MYLLDEMTMSASSSDGSAGVSIRVASRLTGVSADTLRMWERRYGFPKPQRTAAGVRVYSNEEIDRLLLVARALKEGYRPGEAIAKTPGELREALDRSATLTVSTATRSSNVDDLLEALKNDDADELRQRMRQSVATLGAHRFVVEVAAPLSEAVGLAWERGEIEVRHEHLLTEALSTQLRLLLSSYEEGSGGPVVVLTTLPGEMHGLGLEMVALYLAIRGATPRLLGVDAPVKEIVAAASALRAKAVGLSISPACNIGDTAAHLRLLIDSLPAHLVVWLGGTNARNVRVGDPRLVHVPDWSDLDRALARLAD